MRVGLYHWFYWIVIIGMGICWHFTVRELARVNAFHARELEYRSQQMNQLTFQLDFSRQTVIALQQQADYLRGQLHSEAQQARESRNHDIRLEKQIQGSLERKMLRDAQNAKVREVAMKKELVNLRIENTIYKHEEASRERKAEKER